MKKIYLIISWLLFFFCLLGIKPAFAVTADTYDFFVIENDDSSLSLYLRSLPINDDKTIFLIPMESIFTKIEVVPLEQDPWNYLSQNYILTSTPANAYVPVKEAKLFNRDQKTELLNYLDQNKMVYRPEEVARIKNLSNSEINGIVLVVLDRPPNTSKNEWTQTVKLTSDIGRSVLEFNYPVNWLKNNSEPTYKANLEWLILSRDPYQALNEAFNQKVFRLGNVSWPDLATLTSQVNYLSQLEYYDLELYQNQTVMIRLASPKDAFTEPLIEKKAEVVSETDAPLARQGFWQQLFNSIQNFFKRFQ
jgi:hypothetical protein